MSFLRKYLDSNSQLPPISEKLKKTLENVEQELDNKTPGNDKFSEIISEYTDDISDIVLRLKTQFSNWKFSFGNVVSSFRFVFDIVGEVSKIVVEVESKLVPAGTLPDEARKIKITFIQDLTYFVYMLWNPRIVKWVPEFVETWAERKILYWLSGMGADWVLDQLQPEKAVGPQALRLRQQSLEKNQEK